MQISADKTTIVLFSTCLPGPCAWRCNGVSLACVQQAQYLGAVFGDVAGICGSFSKLQRNMLGA